MFLHLQKLLKSLKKTITDKIDEIFPIRGICGPIREKPWITAEISKLARIKQRKYQRHGKSKKYLELENKFKIELKHAISKYRENLMQKLKSSCRSSGYFVPKKMAERLGENFNKGFIFQLNYLYVIPTLCERY